MVNHITNLWDLTLEKASHMLLLNAPSYPKQRQIESSYVCNHDDLVTNSQCSLLPTLQMETLRHKNDSKKEWQARI